MSSLKKTNTLLKIITISVEAAKLGDDLAANLASESRTWHR